MTNTSAFAAASQLSATADPGLVTMTVNVKVPTAEAAVLLAELVARTPGLEVVSAVPARRWRRHAVDAVLTVTGSHAARVAILAEVILLGG